MSEPDHIFISPPPLVATPTAPAAFPFFYVDCERLHRSTCMHPDFNPRQVAPEHIKQVRRLHCVPPWLATLVSLPLSSYLRFPLQEQCGRKDLYVEVP